jgi:hypothetical protein
MDPKLQNTIASPLRQTLAVLLAAAALPASAQAVAAAAPAAPDAAPQVEVKAPRLDFRTVCTEVDAQMLKALAQVAMRERQDGLLNVLFEIDGQRVGAVAISGTPFAYRQATRSAVRGLACNNHGAGRQTVRMQVVFQDL